MLARHGRMNDHLTIDKLGFHVFRDPFVKLRTPPALVGECVLKPLQLLWRVRAFEEFFNVIVHL